MMAVGGYTDDETGEQYVYVEINHGRGRKASTILSPEEARDVAVSLVQRANELEPVN